MRLLEDALGASETKLQAKEYETNATILKWEEHYHILEEQASELSAQLALVATEKERLEELLEAKEVSRLTSVPQPVSITHCPIAIISGGSTICCQRKCTRRCRTTGASSKSIRTGYQTVARYAKF